MVKCQECRQQSYTRSKTIKLFNQTSFSMTTQEQPMSTQELAPQMTPEHNEVEIHQQTISYTLNTANSTLQHLLNATFEQIGRKELLAHYPQFTHHQLMTLLNQFIQQSTPQYGTSRPSKLVEQDLSQTVKIQKDNLTPKQLPKEHPEISQTVKDLDFMSHVGSKKLSITNRSSFLKRKPSQISQIPPAPNTDRTKLPNNSSFKSSQASPQKTQKSVSTKKDPLQNFTSLTIAQDEDPQIVHLRQKANFHLKQKEKQQSLLNQRLKQDQQKVQQFNSQYGQSGLYTFDFEGEAVGADANKDEKLNYYSMKVGIKNLGNKYRTIYKHLQSGKEDKNQLTVIKPRANQHKKSMHENTSLLNATTDIPMFNRESSSFAAEIDPLKLRILEYKRLYGKKFSRYDKNSMTLDVSSVIDRKVTEEDFFAAKRHLTDSLSINKSRSSSMSKEQVARKLALPKLQGKYKVLDRYEEL